MRILRKSVFCAVLACWLLQFFGGCATIESSFNPNALSKRIADESNLTQQRIKAGIFTLTAYSGVRSLGKPLTVYIEGDGRAWLSKRRLSDDPTPLHPMMLKLASIDPSPNVAYLAKPCQYDFSAAKSPCGPEYWSNKRFSEEVIESMNQAISALANQAKTKEVHLVGYSGGAAVSALVASRRTDVRSLRTIAGNLDTDQVNELHEVSKTPESLNPRDVAAILSRLPQRHFIGEKDEIISTDISKSFVKAMGSSPCAQITKVSDATHNDGWIEKWEELLRLPVNCSYQSH